jgi:ankyrin repeat protein
MMKKEGKALDRHFYDKHLLYGVIESADMQIVGTFLEIYEKEKKQLVNTVLDSSGCRPLHVAAKIGSLELLELLIKEGADLTTKNHAGFNALTYSLRMNHDEMISYLLEKYPNELLSAQNLYLSASQETQTHFKRLINLNKSQDLLDEALFLAIQARDIRAFLLLHQNGASFNFVANTGMTPLILASSTGQADILCEILEDKSVKETCVLGNNALHEAAKNGYTHCVSLLLNAGYKNEKNKHGKTPLELSNNHSWLKTLFANKETYNKKISDFTHALGAKQENDLEKLILTINALPLNECIQIEYKGKHIFGTPLQLLLSIHKKTIGRDLIKTILQREDLDLNIPDCNGDTLVHLLLQADISPVGLPQIDWKVSNHQGMTPLHIAANYSSLKTLQSVLDELKQLNLSDLVNVVDLEGRSAIFYAIMEGRENKVDLFIKSGADLNIYDHRLYTPLFVALLLSNPSLSIIKLLLSSGANPNQMATIKHVYPLYCSLEVDNDEIMRCLLSHGADCLMTTPNNLSLLHAAAESGKSQLLRLLVAKGMSLAERDRKGKLPIHFAALFGKTETVKTILSMQREGVDASIAMHHDGAGMSEKENFTEGMTPLHLAARQNHREIIQLLLDSQANVENLTKHHYDVFSLAAATASKPILNLFSPYKIAKSPEVLCSAAKQAIIHDNLDAVIYLYELKIPINAELKEKYTGIQIASKFGSLLTTQWLLKNGADPLLQDSTSKDSLQLSAENDSFQQFALMLEFVNPNLDELRGGREALVHTAARAGKVNHVMILIKNGCSLNIRDIKGYTPLHTAVENKQTAVVDLLLACGAKPSEKTGSGKSLGELVQKDDTATQKVIHYYTNILSESTKNKDTRLHLALRSGNTAALLLAIDSENVNQMNGEGLSPLHLAAKMGQIEACMHLLHAGADIEAKDFALQTPLKIACMNDFSAAEFLVHAGADRVAKDENGTTVIEQLDRSMLPWKEDLINLLRG